jgi:hypothetical protein
MSLAGDESLRRAVHIKKIRPPTLSPTTLPLKALSLPRGREGEQYPFSGTLYAGRLMCKKRSSHCLRHANRRINIQASVTSPIAP